MQGDGHRVLSTCESANENVNANVSVSSCVVLLCVTQSSGLIKRIKRNEVNKASCTNKITEDDDDDE